MIDRDSYCTPSWLTALLPHVDLDPCGNARSTVRARKTYSLERGEDGLALPWFGMVYVNGPFSDLLPWADRLYETYRQTDGVWSAGFLVNADSSTAWWKRLRETLPLCFDFDKRIQFDAPDGVKTSSNSKPQSLLCDVEFWNACDVRLRGYGTLWKQVYSAMDSKEAV